MPTENQLSLEFVDSRTIDGEPADAAEHAVGQLCALLSMLRVGGAITEKMVRNAVMTEGLEKSMFNDPAEWWLESWQKHNVDMALSYLEPVRQWAKDVAAQAAE
jgi:hypothetical protein